MTGSSDPQPAGDTTTDQGADARRLSLPALVGVVAAYLVIVQGVGIALVAGSDFEYGKFPTTESLVRSTTIPVALSVLFAVGVVSWLGWWRRVLHETVRLGRWAWVFPGLMVATVFVVTDYPLLGDVGAEMALVLLGTSLLVGLGEELVFRGITLQSTRQVEGWTERRAALWTAAIFGGAHLTNVVTEGPGALVQVAVVSVAGLFLYIARRVSGGLVVPVLVHAAWDYSLFSGDLGPDPEPHLLAGVAMLTNLVLAVVLVVRRRAIWPGAADRPA